MRTSDLRACTGITPTRLTNFINREKLPFVPDEYAARPEDEIGTWKWSQFSLDQAIALRAMMDLCDHVSPDGTTNSKLSGMAVDTASTMILNAKFSGAFDDIKRLADLTTEDVWVAWAADKHTGIDGTEFNGGHFFVGSRVEVFAFLADKETNLVRIVMGNISSAARTVLTKGIKNGVAECAEFLATL